MQSLACLFQRQLRRSRITLFSLAIPLAATAWTLAGAAESGLRLLYILLGFSLIIFLHELGHFVVARLCSVKCLAFSIGIGPRLCGWRKGGKLTFGNDPYDPEAVKAKDEKHKLEHAEAVTTHSDLPTTATVPPHPATMGDCDYRVSWLPLGGYVRMLGQDDMDPTKISTDPHTFNQRPIWQRMCIVSAGVVMNLIFAAVTFSIIFHPAIGVDFPPALIGQVMVDSPAWKAGIRTGDQVVSINEKPYRGFLEFTDIQMSTALSDGTEAIRFKVRHPNGLEETLPIVPVRSPDNGLLTIGVVPMPGIKIGGAGKEYVNEEQDQLNADDPLYQKNKAEVLKIQDADLIVKVDDVALDGDYMKLYTHMQDLNGKPVKLTLQHKNGTLAAEPVTIYPRLEPLPGVKMQPGVLGLQPVTLLGEPAKGSPGEKGGLKEGDRVLSVGARSYPTVEQMIDIISSSPGMPVDMTVGRKGEAKPLPLTVTPKNDDGKGKIGVPVMQDVDALTFIPPAKESDAGGANVPTGAMIAAIDGTPVTSWQDVYSVLRGKVAETPVNVTFKNGTDELPPVKLAFSTADKKAVTGLMEYKIGLSLENKVLNQHGQNAGEAMLMGLDHTKKFVLQVYSTLAGLFRRTVDPSNLHGIVGITKIGYDVQERGPVWLWYVLAMVSVNLAVANFLPLPIVDGGLFLLLILEKIRGKPLSLKVQSGIQLVGVILLVGLFLFVTYNDLSLFHK